MSVVVGVDGAGRTHRLRAIAAEGGPAAWLTVPDPDPAELATRLAEARATGSRVLVDDAHRLGAETLRAIAAAARDGVPVTIARRPTIDRPELADLDEAAGGDIVELGPLDDVAMTTLLAEVTGVRPSSVTVEAVLTATAGLAGIAAVAPAAVVTPALTARVQRRLATLPAGTAALARILALRLDLTDDALAAAAGLSDIAGAMRTLRDEGLLVPASEQMIPLVAEAVLAELPPAERRRTHDAVARALLGTNADPVSAAVQLRAARVWTPAAAEAYRAAGDRLRFSDPEQALSWYTDAVEAGVEPESVANGRAEAAALLGLPVDVDSGLVAGAVEAHQGRAARSAEALLAADPPGPVLAVPALVATGRWDDAAKAAASPGPVGLRRLAEAALAVPVPAEALPVLIEAVEALERTPPGVVLPDTPHAITAAVAVAAGDAFSAEHVLDRALTAGIGGPIAADRHRLLMAWVRLRTGKCETATAEVRRLLEANLPGRERLLVAALAAGVARRAGDVARLRDAWTAVEPALARRVVDLFQLEAVEELLVAAARLRRHQRVDPVLDALDDIVTRLGRPVAWVVALGWLRLQIAIAAEEGIDAAAAALAAVEPVGARPIALCRAAEQWARLMAGEVDADAVAEVADELAAAELPWEGSRLAGQAAIRTADPGAARRLLERARELWSGDAVAEARTDAPTGGLSEREVEVAHLVLAGRTYREIGVQLYISPKTVEHHVARIRTKLGATTRAEFVAALRSVLAGEVDPT